MASSSDWLTALQERLSDQEQENTSSDWLSMLQVSGEFVEGLPFGGDLAGGADQIDEAVQVELEPEPIHAPQADPIAEAFERGEAAGRAAVLAEQQTLEGQQLVLRQSFRALDQAAMDALANELADTVVALCGQVLADYIPERQALLARCQEAARRLGAAGSDCKLHLHPDDLALIGQSQLEGWHTVADSSVERGGLRFETAEGAISNSPSDWRRAIAAAIRG